MSVQPTTQLCGYTETEIFVRDRNLCDELIGKLGFTDMMFFLVMGRMPEPKETAILDAALVTLMEHGMTPSSVVTRQIYISAPEAVQSAMAAGLLAVGSTFVGTMEGCSALLQDITAAPEGMAAAAKRIAGEHREARKPMPGFGHPLHRPDDPRTPRLLAVAEEQGVSGDYVKALLALGEAVDAAWGRHLTINATGAIAALLLEIGVPSELMRGFAVVSRCAGLLAHVREEQQVPAGRHIWETAAKAVPYAGEALKG